MYEEIPDLDPLVLEGMALHKQLLNQRFLYLFRKFYVQKIMSIMFGVILINSNSAFLFVLSLFS